MTKRAKIQIKHSSRGVQKWWYVLLGGNGEIMVTSEKFGSRSDCRRRVKRFLEVSHFLMNEDIEEV
jgi:uncharacterized protein YegP (UPF0339 family)